MRLIDIDDVRHTYCGDCGEYERWNIDPNLLVDAVPVIRCKDCKYWRANTQFCAMFSGLCTAHRMPPDGYCSEAKRKEE